MDPNFQTTVQTKQITRVSDVAKSLRLVVLQTKQHFQRDYNSYSLWIETQGQDRVMSIRGLYRASQSEEERRKGNCYPAAWLLYLYWHSGECHAVKYLLRQKTTMSFSSSGIVIGCQQLLGNYTEFLCLIQDPFGRTRKLEAGTWVYDPEKLSGKVDSVDFTGRPIYFSARALVGQWHAAWAKGVDLRNPKQLEIHQRDVSYSNISHYLKSCLKLTVLDWQQRITGNPEFMEMVALVEKNVQKTKGGGFAPVMLKPSKVIAVEGDGGLSHLTGYRIVSVLW